MFRNNITTVVMILLLAGIGVTAQAQGTQTIYWLCTDDSAICEGVLPDDSTPTPPESGNWEQITLQGIHDLGRYSPSEEEAAAIEQGNWWEEGATAGKYSVETGWLVLGMNSSGQKFAKGGAGSRRTQWPGRVMAKTVLRKDGSPVRALTVDLPMWWYAGAVTWPAYNYPSTETHYWTDSTEHYYGNLLYYYYRVWPGIWW